MRKFLLRSFQSVCLVVGIGVGFIYRLSDLAKAAGSEGFYIGRGIDGNIRSDR